MCQRAFTNSRKQPSVADSWALPTVILAAMIILLQTPFGFLCVQIAHIAVHEYKYGLGKAIRHMPTPTAP